MKKLSSIIVILILATSISVFAKDNSKKTEAVAKEDISSASSVEVNEIIGKVVDSVSGEPLAGVILAIEGTDLVAFSDFDGNFRFSNVSSKSARLSAKLISYEKTTTNFDDSSEGLVLKLKSIY